MPPEKQTTEESHLPKLRIMQTCPIDFGECKKKEEIEKEFNPSQVFLDIPYLGYPREYEEAIKKAIEIFGLTPVLAEKSRKAEWLLCNVCKTIQKSGYAVADISIMKESDLQGYNPNVLFELGILSSFGKKTCILCHSDTKIPVDLSGLIINKYRNEEIIEKNVSKWITDNIEEIAIKMVKQNKIFGVIFYQLDKKDIREISKKINEIKRIGELKSLLNKYNKVIDRLIVFLNDENPWVRSAAAVELGDIGEPRAIDNLIPALNDENSEVQLRVADALGRMGALKAIGPLFDLIMKEKNNGVRDVAIFALGDIGGRSHSYAIETLITALTNKEIIKHDEDTRTLVPISDTKGIEPIILLLKHEDINIRINAIKILGEIGDIRAIEPLTSLLNDESLNLWAKRAIEKIKSAQKEKKKG